jgi:hypothetical protein
MNQAVAAYASGRGVIGGNLGWEIDRAQDAATFCFHAFRPGDLCRVGSFCQRDIRGSSRVAYTARSLVLTMILKGCRLSEVEVAERNRTMQKVNRLRSQGSEQPDEGSGPGRRP